MGNNARSRGALALPAPLNGQRINYHTWAICASRVRRSYDRFLSFRDGDRTLLTTLLIPTLWPLVTHLVFNRVWRAGTHLGKGWWNHSEGGDGLTASLRKPIQDRLLKFDGKERKQLPGIKEHVASRGTVFHE